MKPTSAAKLRAAKRLKVELDAALKAQRKEQRLQAAGFESVSIEQRADNLEATLFWLESGK